jgi:replicative DNA helicase
MNEQRSDRTTEQALLAACLTSKTARQEARRHITGGDFDYPAHASIWAAMGSLDRHDKSVDPVTVLAALGTDRAALEVMPALVTAVALPDSVPEYAAIVRGWSVRRALDIEAIRVRADAFNPDANVGTLAANVASRFIAIRDGGAAATEDITALTARELLEQEDDEPDWLIPNLLERRDRLILTGEEGLGKSHMLRQIAVHVAAGLDPFHDKGRTTAGRALIVDCENTWSQVRRKLRPAIEFASIRGEKDVADRLVVDCTNRMDITRDRDLARIHQLLDAYQPDLVVIGPLYRLVPRALQTDDDTAPVLAALDTIRDRGAALLMEAHAGHAQGARGIRDMRPRGSSSLMGWPEFGFGLRGVSEGIADVIPWRGQREERDWPQRVRRSEGFRWMPHNDLYGWNQEIPA